MDKPKPIHWLMNPAWKYVSRCGAELSSESYNATPDKKMVTCKRCIRWMSHS